MTRSFASMLALLLAAWSRAGRAADAAAWRGPTLLATIRADAGARPRRPRPSGGGWGRRTGAGSSILGGGPAFGIAAEWGLKLTETSQVPTSAYEPLEFRHGPISVCEPGTLVVGLVGGPGRGRRGRGRRRRPPGWGRRPGCWSGDEDEAGDAAGEVSRIGGGLHPAARLPLLVHPAHALALSLALTRGCDPDAPRHLGQVVILDRE